MSAKPILPSTGSRVRLRSADRDCLVEVTGVEEGAVRLRLRLAQDEPAGRAQILFSSPRGVVALGGELEPKGTTTTLVVESQEWLAQRRETFRLAVGCGMTITRADGSTIAGTVTDLSITGALLGDAAEDLESDEHVEVVIEAGEIGEVEVAGTVVRKDGPRRAIRFDPLPANAQSNIERFLASEQRLRMQRRSA
jgi:hypothetical protein